MFGAAHTGRDVINCLTKVRRVLGDFHGRFFSDEFGNVDEELGVGSGEPGPGSVWVEVVKEFAGGTSAGQGEAAWGGWREDRNYEAGAGEGVVELDCRFFNGG